MSAQSLVELEATLPDSALVLGARPEDPDAYLRDFVSRQLRNRQRKRRRRP